ncbi:hypothetical protein K9M79_07990 [Candidatus Woesearchaeota archaeon]|nr:hypothetical protein [Candidatus Woesearchaeota archaeon]
MKYSIIISQKDTAGMNILDTLISEFGFRRVADEINYLNPEYPDIEILSIDKDTIFADGLDNITLGDTIIFATRHSCGSEKKSLCIHVPGNWSENTEYGGKPHELCTIPADLERKLYLNMVKNAQDFDAEVTVEATHHGPKINKPCLFIEIGNNEEQWRDKQAAKIISKTLIDTLTQPIDLHPTVLVFGSGHYNQTANKILMKYNYSVGHICPKYALQYLTENIVQKAIDHTLEPVEMIVLDWKGMGPEKTRIVDLLEKMNLLGLKSEVSSN